MNIHIQIYIHSTHSHTRINDQKIEIDMTFKWLMNILFLILIKFQRKIKLCSMLHLVWCEITLQIKNMGLANNFLLKKRSMENYNEWE